VAKNRPNCQSPGQDTRETSALQKDNQIKKGFLAHDELERCQVGDLVRIAESRPISKLKRWRVAEIIGLASREIESEIKDELS